jgi:hypothetical protein
LLRAATRAPRSYMYLVRVRESARDAAAGRRGGRRRAFHEKALNWNPSRKG